MVNLLDVQLVEERYAAGAITSENNQIASENRNDAA